MSETSMINFRMDSDLKKNMESVCREMGLSMSAAFILFATKLTRERRIPFEINADPFYSASNMAHLNRVIAEIDSGAAELTTHELTEV